MVSDGTLRLDYSQKHDAIVAGMFAKFMAGILTTKEFSKLDDRVKWDMSKMMKGVMWCCGKCGLEQGKKPTHASPFHGAEVFCWECDHRLTHRTGGGQNNSFGYTFKIIKNKRDARHSA